MVKKVFAAKAASELIHQPNNFGFRSPKGLATVLKVISENKRAVA
jgi:hypothetical protein